MGFPRQKVKARRVAPSESGSERVSRFLFSGETGSWLPDSKLSGTKKTFLRPHARSILIRLVATGLWPVSVGAVLTLDDSPQGRGYSG